MNITFSRALGRYALAIVVSTMLAACGSSSDSTPGNGSNPGSDVDSNPADSGGGTNSDAGSNDKPAPSQNLDEKLVGSWYLGSISGSYYDSSGNYVGVSGAGALQGFDADGTYWIVVLSTGSYMRLETYESGKWRVNGDTVQVYDATYESRMNGSVTAGGPHADHSFQYRVGSDDDGDFLMTSNDDADPITDDSAKYRRSK